MYDIIIIGMGISGITAGIYAKRSNKKVLLIDKGMPGGLLNNIDKISNYPGLIDISGPDFAEILEKQVMSPVYFEKSIRYMIDQGVDTIIEVGPGKVLSGFVRKIDRSIQLYQIEDMESLKKTVKALKGE